jgi:hypothetical protein
VPVLEGLAESVTTVTLTEMTLPLGPVTIVSVDPFANFNIVVVLLVAEAAAVLDGTEGMLDAAAIAAMVMGTSKADRTDEIVNAK